MWTVKQQCALHDEILKERLATLMPRLMRECASHFLTRLMRDCAGFFLWTSHGILV